MTDNDTSGGILFVCDANVCRSVTAQFVLAQSLESKVEFDGVTIESRGVNVVGAAKACRRIGELNPAEVWRDRIAAHRSNAVDADAIGRARLILTASRSSRSAVVAMSPEARRRVFTLREAVWLADGYRPGSGDERFTGAAAIDELAVYLDGQRGMRALPTQKRRFWQRHQLHPMDIRDGHLGDARAHTATVAQVRELTLHIAGLISGDPRLRFLSTDAPPIE